MLIALGASLFTRIVSRVITVADDNPGWRGPLIAGWAGMRGVVSLAAALSIPLMISGGQAFPHRNLILFITFIVILVTLVFQGLTLPWLIQKVKPEDRGNKLPEDQQEIIIQKKLAKHSLSFLEEKYSEDWKTNEHINNLQTRLKLAITSYGQILENIEDSHKHPLRSYQQIYLKLLEQQREMLMKMNDKEEFDEDVIRKFLGLIDMEEFKIREKILEK